MTLAREFLHLSGQWRQYLHRRIIMCVFKYLLLGVFAAVITFNSNAHAADPQDGRKFLRGAISKSFDSCGGTYPDSIPVDLNVSWAFWVYFKVKDSIDQITLTANTLHNSVFGRRLFPGTNGESVEVAYDIKHFFKRNHATPKAVVTKFYTLIVNQSYVCQVAYSGNVRRSKR